MVKAADKNSSDLVYVINRSADIQASHMGGHDEQGNYRSGVAWDFSGNPIVDEFKSVSYRNVLNRIFTPIAWRKSVEWTLPHGRNYVFGGMTIGGDKVDSPCMGEYQLIFDQVNQLPEALKPNQDVRGNHDGAAWKGYVYDVENRMEVPGRPKFSTIYPGLMEEASKTCGVPDELVRIDDALQMSRLLSGGLVSVASDDESWLGQGTDLVGARRWEKVAYKSRTEQEQQAIQDRIENGLMLDDAQKLYRLSAIERASFGVGDNPLRLIEVALDTQDMTEASLEDSLEFGRLSSSQIQDVKDFIEERLIENPNTRFTLAMHFTPQALESESLIGLKEIYEDENVIALHSAHVHRGGLRDATVDFDLNRSTPLPIVWTPSPTDRSDSMHIEHDDDKDVNASTLWQFISVEAGEQGTVLSLDFEYDQILPTDIPNYKVLNDYLTDWAKDSGFNTQNQVAEDLPFPLKRLVMHDGNLVSNLLSAAWMDGSLTDAVLFEGTLSQYLADSELVSSYVDEVTIPLLRREGYDTEAMLFSVYNRQLKADLSAQTDDWYELSTKGPTEALTEFRRRLVAREKSGDALDWIEFTRALNALPENSLAQSAAVLTQLYAMSEDYDYTFDSTNVYLQDKGYVTQTKPVTGRVEIDYEFGQDGDGVLYSQGTQVQVKDKKVLSKQNPLSLVSIN